MEAHRLSVLCIDSVHSAFAQYLFLETVGISVVLRFVWEEWFGIQICYKIQFGDHVCECEQIDDSLLNNQFSSDLKPKHVVIQVFYIAGRVG